MPPKKPLGAFKREIRKNNYHLYLFNISFEITSPAPTGFTAPVMIRSEISAPNGKTVESFSLIRALP
jgi:hypothetical protein